MKRALIILGITIIILILGWYFVNKIIPINLLLSGGPGGCKGPNCEAFCQQNPLECQKWCEENPETCQQFMGGGLGEFPDSGFFGSSVDPPDTVITYAKTLNFNSGAFSEEDIIKAKNLGVNMVTLWPAKRVSNDKFTFFPEAQGFPNFINIAHKNGLQVELRGSFGGGMANDYEKFKTNAIAYVVEFAQFAEKHKVYRIVPFGEIDNHMFNHCDKITELAEELLIEMRKHYNGQIGVGVVASWRDCGFTFNGYDYLTVSVYPQTQTGMDAWLTTTPEINLNSVVDWARSVADRSGISNLHIGETGVQNIGEKDPLGFFQTVEVSKEKEAEFYEKEFSLISDKVDGVSAFYNSKSFFLGVNGDPAENVIEDWYTNKLK